jgi:alkanesulfonate monooxygenase SsuD/methylene tetrahydromethanopterin reductase-like flavin-dependent oxidoreductase (luciferase family)
MACAARRCSNAVTPMRALIAQDKPGAVRGPIMERLPPMQLQLAFELRSPACGAPHRELYAAMLDICEWADGIGFDLVNFGEHHGADSGYNPSPLITCAAVAGRTRRIHMRPNVLLAPLYDPVKLAEDSAVLALLAPGRFSLAIGGGYRPSEFAMFGQRLDARWAAIGETVELLRSAWSGERFEYRGRSMRVTPAPDPAPPILLGGSSEAAARRAARIADGWIPPLDPRLWTPYREECLRIGKPDPGLYPAHGPTFLWIDDDVDAAWEMLAPHVVSQIEEYGQFTREGFGEAKGPYRGATDAAALRGNRAYRVLPVAETVALAQGLGDNAVLLFNPLLGGIAPREAWKMLRRFEEHVLPMP